MNRKPSAMISYYHGDDHGYMALLHAYIQDELGFPVWADSDISAGSTWKTIIDEELGKATHLVLIWTPNVTKSEHVIYEWAVALISGIHIIPILSPEYDNFRPSDVPELLANLNFIRDPIKLNTEQKRLIQAFANTDHNDLLPLMPMALLAQFRSAEKKDWEQGLNELKDWVLKASDPKLLEHVDWLLRRIAQPDGNKDRHAVLLEASHLVRDQKELVEASISLDSIAELRQSLRLLAHTLQESKVPGEKIQAIVKSQICAWSMAQYGTPKPPPPKLPPGFEFDTKRKRTCGLCLLKIQADKHACCSDCGLFMSFWESISEDEN